MPVRLVTDSILLIEGPASFEGDEASVNTENILGGFSADPEAGGICVPQPCSSEGESTFEEAERVQSVRFDPQPGVNRQHEAIAELLAAARGLVRVQSDDSLPLAGEWKMEGWVADKDERIFAGERYRFYHWPTMRAVQLAGVKGRSPDVGTYYDVVVEQHFPNAGLEQGIRVYLGDFPSLGIQTVTYTLRCDLPLYDENPALWKTVMGAVESLSTEGRSFSQAFGPMRVSLYGSDNVTNIVAPGQAFPSEIWEFGASLRSKNTGGLNEMEDLLLEIEVPSKEEGGSVVFRFQSPGGTARWPLPKPFVSLWHELSRLNPLRPDLLADAPGRADDPLDVGNGASGDTSFLEWNAEKAMGIFLEDPVYLDLTEKEKDDIARRFGEAVANDSSCRDRYFPYDLGSIEGKDAFIAGAALMRDAVNNIAPDVLKERAPVVPAHEGALGAEMRMPWLSAERVAETSKDAARVRAKIEIARCAVEEGKRSVREASEGGGVPREVERGIKK